MLSRRSCLSLAPVAGSLSPSPTTRSAPPLALLLSLVNDLNSRKALSPPYRWSTAAPTPSRRTSLPQARPLRVLTWDRWRGGGFWRIVRSSFSGQWCGGGFWSRKSSRLLDFLSLLAPFLDWVDQFTVFITKELIRYYCLIDFSLSISFFLFRLDLGLVVYVRAG